MDISKKVIGLDMDGVIIDHTENKITMAARYGFTLAPKDTSSDAMRGLIPDEVRTEIQHAIYGDLETNLPVPPMIEGARQGLEIIKNSTHPYALISRRKNPEAAVALLKTHGLWPLFFSESNTFFVNEPEDKDIKARELHVTHYMDDETKVLAKLISVPQRFLLDPYAALPDADFYTRVRTWTEFIAHLNRS